MPDTIQVDHLTRRLDHSVPDGDFVPEVGVECLTRRLDHSVPDDDFAPKGTEI
ncbi:hypothetical protein [Streptomyces rubellomurinus]|uniref:Uncharacterized protein n=1 Tax=Streptomyces sp. Y1 TaxID=3238634 RepID=A0AB39TGR1_9ACTN|nr:hypothetical protein [Streptomyces rubellomurinus]